MGTGWGTIDTEYIEEEVHLAQVLGGIDVVKFESMDDPSSAGVIAKDRQTRLQHIRFNMSVDVS